MHFCGILRLGVADGAVRAAEDLAHHLDERSGKRVDVITYQAAASILIVGAEYRPRDVGIDAIDVAEVDAREGARVGHHTAARKEFAAEEDVHDRDCLIVLAHDDARIGSGCAHRLDHRGSADACRYSFYRAVVGADEAARDGGILSACRHATLYSEDDILDDAEVGGCHGAHRLSEERCALLKGNVHARDGAFVHCREDGGLLRGYRAVITGLRLNGEVADNGSRSAIAEERRVVRADKRAALQGYRVAAAVKDVIEGIFLRTDEGGKFARLHRDVVHECKDDGATRQAAADGGSHIVEVGDGIDARIDEDDHHVLVLDGIEGQEGIAVLAHVTRLVVHLDRRGGIPIVEVGALVIRHVGKDDPLGEEVYTRHDLAVALDIEIVDGLCALARALYLAVQGDLPDVHRDDAVQVACRAAEVFLRHDRPEEEGDAMVHRRLGIADEAARAGGACARSLRRDLALVCEIYDEVIHVSFAVVAYRTARIGGSGYLSRRTRGYRAVDKDVGFSAVSRLGDTPVVLGQEVATILTPIGKVGSAFHGAVVDTHHSARVDHVSELGGGSYRAAFTHECQTVGYRAVVRADDAAYRIPRDDAARLDVHIAALDGAVVYVHDGAVDIIHRARSSAHRAVHLYAEVGDGARANAEDALRDKLTYASIGYADGMITILRLAAEGALEAMLRIADGHKVGLGGERDGRAEVKGDVFKGISAHVDVLGYRHEVRHLGEGRLDDRYLVMNTRIVDGGEEVAFFPVGQVARLFFVARRKHRFGYLLIFLKGLVPAHDGDMDARVLRIVMEQFVGELHFIGIGSEVRVDDADTDDGHHVDAGITHGADADGVDVGRGVHERPDVLEEVGGVIADGKPLDPLHARGGQGVEARPLGYHDDVGEGAVIIGDSARVARILYL